MNARQKAKKYKKELENLKARPINPTIVYASARFNAKEIKSQVLLDYEMMQINPDDLDELIRSKLTKQLEEYIKKGLTYTTKQINENVKVESTVLIGFLNKTFDIC